MTLESSLRATLTEALESPVRGLCRLSPRGLCETYAVETDARTVFVKTHRCPPRTSAGLSLFEAEARGLALLAPLVPTPAVLFSSAEALALEFIPSRPRSRASEVSAAHSLARLHAQRAPSFGLSYDNFIGTLVQDNRASSSFPAFFREHRLEPLAHHLPPTLRSALARLDLESRLVPTEPTLIHGDLWAGNLLHAEPAIFIDPSVSYGHPAQDLAMARLFGGFSEVFFETYAETSGFAFDKDLDVSLDVLTLYPLLVHVALFGDGYLPDIASILTRLR